MFLGGLSISVIEQVYQLLSGVDTSRVYICCSGSFRSERTIYQYNRDAQLFSNDVSLFSCVIGRWLADDPLPFRFIDELEPLEAFLVDASPTRRVAAVSFALDVTNWASGKQNPYKQAHYRELMTHADDYITQLQAKIAGAFGLMKLARYDGRDWIVHMEEALAEKATIVTFPPFYKGDYEKLYKWLDERVEWERPTYDLYDPKNLPALVDRIRDSDSDYIFISDQKIPGHEPRALWRAHGRADCWLYARRGEARLQRSAPKIRPFNYKVLDVGKITENSVVTVTPADAPDAFYVRQIYVKKSIMITSARFNFFVYIDDMLAGVMAYDPLDFNRNAVDRRDVIYLLSDLAVTTQARVSKLIVRLTRNMNVLKVVEARQLEPIGYVVTTAFSENPVSMKYRGVYDLLDRREAHAPMVGFQLRYGAEAIDETPQQAFEWWWLNHGGKKKHNPDAGAGAKRAPNAGRRR